MSDYSHEFNDGNIISLKKSISSRPKPHCLIGVGVGNQLYSKYDPSWKGLWLEEQYEVDSGFADDDGLLQKYTDAEWGKRQQDSTTEIESAYDAEHQPPKRGDLCRVSVAGEPVEILEVKQVDIGKSTYTVQLGTKRPDFKQLWQSRRSGGSGYQDYYLWASKSNLTGNCNFKFSDNTHTCTAGSMNFVVPDDVLDAALLPRILLDISLSLAIVQTRLHRWGVVVKVDGATNQYCIFENYLLDPSGSISISDIDITDLVTENATNVVTVELFLHDEEYWVAHSTCTDHPAVACSATMKFDQRLFGP